jgi:hypothetical protein
MEFIRVKTESARRDGGTIARRAVFEGRES